MNLSNKIATLSLSAALVTTATAGEYLIKKGDLSIAQSISYTTYDQFWVGSAKQPGVPGGGDIERTSYRTYLYYGIDENFALDASIGYADISSGLTDSGSLADSSIGLSWQLANESDSALDWMVRTGINIAGDYETGFISAPGDGENGIDLMTKFGRSFGSNGARGDVEVGYTLNNADVPDSFRLRAGPTIPVGKGVSLDFSGIYFAGVDGIDIGGTGFTGLIDLPKVQEKGTAGELGISFGAGNGYYRFSVSKVFDGENIGDEFTIGGFASFKF